MILDPAEVPALDVGDIFPAPAGLDPGYWIYRVSALFSAADLDNPLGESLPSDEVILKVPSFTGKKIQVLLAWQPPRDSLGATLPNVAGYNVYRTPVVNGISGQEVLLATVAGALREGKIDEAIKVAERNKKSHLAKVVTAGLQEFKAHGESTEIPGEQIEATVPATNGHR